MKTENSFESVSGSSPKRCEGDHLVTQLDLLIDSCSLILTRSHKLSESISRSNASHISQVHSIYNKHKGEIENYSHKTY
jgi:hypothetical protein